MTQVYGTNLDSKCAVCNDIVEITGGAVLYDTKWYHQKCWYKDVKMVKVIVVDNDVDTVEVFCEYLEIKDITVLGRGYDGKTAVELYERLRPDIALLDIMMPEYDGFFALENIRQINPNAKIIMVTVDLTADTEKKIKSLNASAVIYKPYEIDSVIDTICHVSKQAVTLTQ